jgi:transcriptional regulator with XRE-family HTH domain
MAQRLKTYLRTLRRRSGLTQRELAFLLGLKGGSAVSRMEGLKRVPTLIWTRACVLIFGTRALELFPSLFAEVREAVRSRANELYMELQGNPSKTTRAKLNFLEEVLARLERESDDFV